MAITMSLKNVNLKNPNSIGNVPLEFGFFYCKHYWY